jgi:hypothetical protein
MRRCCIAILLGLSPIAYAQETGEFHAQLSVVPTNISGTLAPLSIAVEDQPVAHRPFTTASLEINGETIAPGSTESQPFFYRTTENHIVFTFEGETKGQTESIAVRMPVMRVLGVGTESLVCGFSGDIQQVRIDQKPLILRKHRAVWYYPAEADWEEHTHIVEIEGPPGKPSRLYNLNISHDAVPAPEPETDRALPARWPRVSWLSFEAAGLATLQTSGGQAFTFGGGWSPQTSFSDSFGIGIDLSFTAMRQSNGGYFPAVETVLLPDYYLTRYVDLAVGGGAETWIGYGGTLPELTSQLGVRLSGSGLIRVYAGYAVIFDTGNLTHQLKLAATIRF